LGGSEAFAAVLAAHFQTHQALQPQDVYKLIYQRVFGPEHLIDNPRAAWERLYLEVLQLPQSDPPDPLVESLSPELCRVNLHPFIHRGGSVEALWRAFRQTARAHRPGTLEDLQRTWRVFLGTSWASRYAPEQLEQFWLRMATADFPPVHHSRTYTEANAPHYRVVWRSLIPDQPPFTP
jgi:hypothetical protein